MMTGEKRFVRISSYIILWTFGYNIHLSIKQKTFQGHNNIETSYRNL